MERSKNTDRRRSAVLLLVPALALVTSVLVAAGDAAAQGAPAPTVPLLEAVTGDYTRTIDTDAPLAQAYFDQGMQMVYAFTLPVAIRSFEEAQRQDPDCAVCFWGEAKARGPFLNGRLTNANAGPAYEAAQRALSLIARTDDPMEKAPRKGHQPPRRVSPLHPRDRGNRGGVQGGGMRGLSHDRGAGVEPSQPHAVAHLQRDRALGKGGALKRDGLAFRRPDRVRRGGLVRGHA